ncbi:MAG: bifunctional oligoribonuclease/PAP phosphatase NrnA [Bacteroidales bacterium]|nr:bifunctional oligoribonuclease/PAP phosphatase NrnA [Bacteroidales bacterium]
MCNELIIKLIIDIIKRFKKIVIVSHVNPDGDALGSSLALYHLAKKMGAEPKVIIPNDYPSFLSWMPGIHDVLIYDKNTELASRIMSEADLFCFLDFNVVSRTGLMHNDLCHYNKTPRILIDHHIGADPTQFLACYSNTEVSSTSEMVAEVVKYCGFEDYLDDSIAACVLVGMITDTGSFSHSIFRNTFNMCGEILSLSNVNYKEIHQNIYDNSTESRLRLLGFLINDRMIVLNEYNTAYIYASKDDLESFNYQIGDTEGVVNYPLSISNIKMSVFITERQGCIRLSFRSKGDFSVNDLTRKHFNGGGHLNAAGGTLECTLEEAIEKLVSILPEYKHLLNK